MPKGTPGSAEGLCRILTVASLVVLEDLQGKPVEPVLHGMRVHETTSGVGMELKTLGWNASSLRPCK